MYHGREKRDLQTVWKEMTDEFKDLQWINITKDSIRNSERDHEMSLTKDDQSRETITQTRF